MSQPYLPQSWWPETIRFIVEEGLTPLPGESSPDFVVRANLLAGYNTPEEEVKASARSRMWREHLDAALRQHHAALYQTTAQDKAVLLGEMVALSRDLKRVGKWKDAADVLMNVAKAEGIAGGDTSVSIFNELSGSELQAAIAKVRERREALPPPSDKVN